MMWVYLRERAVSDFGAHARGSLHLSVTTLAASASAYTCNQRYSQA